MQNLILPECAATKEDRLSSLIILRGKLWCTPLKIVCLPYCAFKGLLTNYGYVVFLF
jgi:hypothetical protein